MAVARPSFQVAGPASASTTKEKGDESEDPDDSTSKAKATPLMLNTGAASMVVASGSAGGADEDGGESGGTKGEALMASGGLQATTAGAPPTADLINNLALSRAHLNRTFHRIQPVLGRFLGQEPVPRSKIDAGIPVAPDDEPGDGDVFEAASGDGRYYMPRYDLADRSGTEVDVQLRQTDDGGELTVGLRRELPFEDASEMEALDHDLELLLRYDAAGTLKERTFQDYRFSEAGDRVTATLIVTGGGALAELYDVLQSSGDSPQLIARRPVTLAVPTDERPQEVKELRKELKETEAEKRTARREERTLQQQIRSARTLGTAGAMVGAGQKARRRARKLEKRRSQIVDRVEELEAEQEEQEERLDELEGREYYEVGERPMEMVVDEPFSFPADLAYIFPDISPGGGPEGPRPHDLNGYTYYQDRAEPELFRYLPDEFRLTRRPEPPYEPAVSVNFLHPDDGGGDTRVDVSYFATPWVDMKRLARAREQLAEHVPEDRGPIFEPIVASESPTYRLYLPGGGEDGPFTERPGASVHLRDGIEDVVRMSLEDFRTVYSSLMGGQSQVFRGEVLIDLGGDRRHRIPFNSRMRDLTGEVFTYEEEREEGRDRFDVTLTNAVESPVAVSRLEARLVRRGSREERPATVQRVQGPGGEESLPMEVPAGAELRLRATFEEAPPGDGALDPVFDYDVRTLSDPDAIWSAIVDPSVEPTRTRKVTVKVPSTEIFASSSDGEPDVNVILVDFVDTPTVAELTPDQPENTVTLQLPARDYVVSGATGQALEEGYRYRIRVIQGGERKETEVMSASRSLLFVVDEDLP